MILSDSSIKAALQSGTVVIDPLGPEAVQPGSIDLRLGSHFLILDEYQMQTIEMGSPISYREINGDSITIAPHSFLLATTMEYIKLPADITGMVEGRSSVGRMGLFIHNAGLIDAGFEGAITLELYNGNSLPIRLNAGRRICQLVLYKMDKPAERPYSGKYQGQKRTVGSEIYKDSELSKNPQTTA